MSADTEEGVYIRGHVFRTVAATQYCGSRLGLRRVYYRRGPIFHGSRHPIRLGVASFLRTPTHPPVSVSSVSVPNSSPPETATSHPAAPRVPRNVPVSHTHTRNHTITTQDGDGDNPPVASAPGNPWCLFPRVSGECLARAWWHGGMEWPPADGVY